MVRYVAASLPLQLLSYELTKTQIWETSPRSLRALSLVNSSCYNASAPFVYNKLSLRIRGRGQLYRQVTKLTEGPVAQMVFQYLRRLEVSGYMPISVYDKDKDETYEESSLEEDQGLSQGRAIDDFDPELDYVLCSFPLDDLPHESLSAWSPLIGLISRLHHLADIIFDCNNQVPPGLPETLHRYHPSCRLDVRSFRFHSLLEHVTDSRELALATSPCLYGLSVRYSWRDSKGFDDYNEEAVMRTVALAPNLKHVRMLRCRPASTAALARSRGRARPPWKGFVPPVQTFNRGSLETLVCANHSGMNNEYLQKWEQYTDLSSIRTLALKGVSDSQLLVDSAVNARFKAVERLAISFEPEEHDDNFKAAVATFFESLNPLKVLRLTGSLDAAVSTQILQRHGATLRELQVQAYEVLPYGDPRDPLFLTSTDILTIRDTCPQLADLKLTIKRHKSSKRETRCYEALGTFPALQHLEIFLDCSNPKAPQQPSAAEEPDAYDRHLWDTGCFPLVYNAHIRDALINSAIDDVLARSIWDVIASRKPGRPLAALTVTSDGGGALFAHTSSGGLHTRIHHLSRSYRLTRRDDDGGGVEVVELGRKARETYDASDREHEDRMKESGRTGCYGPMTTAFERIWPRKEGTRDWREDWRSWPLERTGQVG